MNETTVEIEMTKCPNCSYEFEPMPMCNHEYVKCRYCKDLNMYNCALCSLECASCGAPVDDL